MSLALGLFISGAVWFLQFAPFQGDRFDAARWKQAGRCQDLSDQDCFRKEASCLRGGMVRDLTSNHLLPGVVSRVDVLELLGAFERDIKINGQVCRGYNLGMCSGLGLDHDSLYICFDDEGRIRSSGHIQH